MDSTGLRHSRQAMLLPQVLLLLLFHASSQQTTRPRPPTASTTPLSCHPDRCFHGGRCVLGPPHGSPMCICTVGYAGDRCQLSTRRADPCAIPQPCANSGTCTLDSETASGYRCICPAGLSGTFCESRIPSGSGCRTTGCPADSICAWDGHCRCKSGTEGKAGQCRTPKPSPTLICVPNPCYNDGHCIAKDYTRIVSEFDHAFTCACTPAWTGRLCETPLIQLGADRPADNLLQARTPAEVAEPTTTESSTKPLHVSSTQLAPFTESAATFPVSFVSSTQLPIRTTSAAVTFFKPVTTVSLAKPTSKPTDNIRLADQALTTPSNACPAVVECEPGYKCVPRGSVFICEPELIRLGVEHSTLSPTLQTSSRKPTCLWNGGCLNGGTCLALATGPKCICTTGWTGDMCELDIDECALGKNSPCPPPATCINDPPGTYTCNHPPTTPRTTTTAPTPKPCPCLNGGYCSQSGLCNCPPGFTGVLCESSVRQPEEQTEWTPCISAPCLNGGSCFPVANRTYRCDCLPDFAGDRCEVGLRVNTTLSSPTTSARLAKTCDSSMCNFNGYCNYIDETSFKCRCFAGYSGQTCDNKIISDWAQSATQPSGQETPCPCENGGICLLKDRSDTSTFTCQCPPEFAGSLCNATAESTSAPPTPSALRTTTKCLCQNGGTCTRTNRGALHCHCPAGYTGVLCETILAPTTPAPALLHEKREPTLQSCDQCDAPKKCRKLPSGSSSCMCQVGLTGEACDVSTAATFLGNSTLVLVSHPAQLPYDLSFDFRSSLSDGLLVTAEDIVGSVVFTVHLHRGALLVTFSPSNESATLQMKDQAGATFNDAEWHSVVIQHREDGHLLVNSEGAFAQLRPRLELLPVFSTKLGGLPGSEASYDSTNTPNFIGCLREISLNAVVQVPHKASSRNVVPGCNRNEQCTPSSCFANLDHGKCVDLWATHVCQCERPWLEPDCDIKFPEATFGFGANNSLAHIIITPSEREQLKYELDLSFELRTRAQNATVFYVGQNIDTATLQQQSPFTIYTFISAELVNSKPQLAVKIGPGPVNRFPIDIDLADGLQHLIQLLRSDNTIRLTIDKQTAFTHSFNYSVVFPMTVDVILFGGLPSPASLVSVSDRYRRQVTDISLIRIPSQAFTVNGTPLKGTLQDIRFGPNQHAILHPLPGGLFPLGLEIFGQTDMRNVLPGVTSDPMCASSPCQNGAACNESFNHFECVCAPGWRGQLCEKRDLCATVKCPAGTCEQTETGYVCVGPVTFLRGSGRVSFLASSSSRPFTSLHFRLRARQPQSLLFYAEAATGTSFIVVELRAGALSVGYNVDGKTDRYNSEVQINDGVWHSVTIAILPDGLNVTVDDITDRSGTGSSTPLSRIFNGNATLLHVSGIPGAIAVSYSGDDRFAFPLYPFEGCMDEVYFGDSLYAGEALQFVAADSLPPVPRLFQLHDGSGAVPGCLGTPACIDGLQTCRNGGSCIDVWNEYECRCEHGFEGRYCEINTDDCAENQCFPGSLCVDGIATYTCVCAPGYTGSLCDVDIDDCPGAECLHGGTCRDMHNDYECDCPAEYVGVKCQYKAAKNCAESPCANNAACLDLTAPNAPAPFECLCPPHLTGVRCEKPVDHCANSSTCLNGATCLNKETGYNCDCTEGFEGQNCEVNTDDCVEAELCNGHGTCVDGISSHSCICEEGWIGEKCDRNLNECLSNPCLYGGTCTDTDGGFRCLCPPHYLGQICELPGSCLATPCRRGVCNQINETEHSCTCPPGYTGPTCSDEIDFCADSPCVNGGSCSSVTAKATFVCSCVTGFKGQTCEVNIDDCPSVAACQNGGICVDGIADYSCDCKGTGYRGPRCETDVDECVSNVCVRGTCENLKGSFNCSCFTGYLGPTCSVPDPCKSNRTNDCTNGASCVNARINDGRSVIYDCLCPPGFSGNRCEVRQEPHVGTVPLLYVVGPVFGFIVILCMVGFVVFILVARQKRANQGAYSPAREETKCQRLQAYPIYQFSGMGQQTLTSGYTNRTDTTAISLPLRTVDHTSAGHLIYGMPSRADYRMKEPLTVPVADRERGPI